MNLDEPITIEEYNPRWPKLFEQEAPAVAAALWPLVVDVQQFGGTAVPGLASKPMIDVLVGLRHLQVTDANIEALRQLGYENCGEAGIPGRLYLRKRGPESFNLMVTTWGSPLWTDPLLIREFLRAHPDEAQHYAEHKKELFASGAQTLIQYSELKRPIIASILQRAREWYHQKALEQAGSYTPAFPMMWGGFVVPVVFVPVGVVAVPPYWSSPTPGQPSPSSHESDSGEDAR